MKIITGEVVTNKDQTFKFKNKSESECYDSNLRFCPAALPWGPGFLLHLE